MSDQTNPLIGLYRLCGAIGNTMPGAPVVHYSLLVNPSRGTVTGVVHITQAIAPPNGNIMVNVSGTIHEIIFGADLTKLIILNGEFVESVTPPAIGSYLVKFTAHMALNKTSNGVGGFEYGHTRIENSPVKNMTC